MLNIHRTPLQKYRRIIRIEKTQPSFLAVTVFRMITYLGVIKGWLTRLSMHFAAISIFTALAASPVKAGQIAQHTGANDPTTEGWLAPLHSGIASPVYNDGGSGINAWQVAKSNPGGANFYGALLTPTDATAARNNGWTFNSDEKLIGNFFDTTQGSPSVLGWSDTTLNKTYAVSLFSNGSGDVIASLLGNTNATSTLIALNGIGLGYHDYSLNYDAGTGLATFSVDGTIETNSYSGSIGALPFDVAAWGTGDSGSAAGAANYDSVSFTVNNVVPEPSSLILTALGALGLATVSVRRRSGPHRRLRLPTNRRS